MLVKYVAFERDISRINLWQEEKEKACLNESGNSTGPPSYLDKVKVTEKEDKHAHKKIEQKIM